MSWYSTCLCHTCNREFQALGIARHRAMHRDKKENCKITYSNGDTYTYNFAKTEIKNETP